MPRNQESAPTGLLGYEGLRERLAIDGKKPCLRKVKALVARYKAVIRPVQLGHKMVGFRPSSVDAFLAHLAGDPVPGQRQL